MATAEDQAIVGSIPEVFGQLRASFLSRQPDQNRAAGTIAQARSQVRRLGVVEWHLRENKGPQVENLAARPIKNRLDVQR